MTTALSRFLVYGSSLIVTGRGFVSKRVQMAIIVMSMLLAVLINNFAAGAGFEDLPGRYCASRANGCCNGRLDQCSVPVYGTFCYCDDFCDRQRTDDCCPDYWSFCKHQAPNKPEEERRCFSDGKYYNYGEEVKINCNTCKCQSRGTFDCEKNICLLDEELNARINDNSQLGWQAQKYSEFWGRTLLDGIIHRTGTLEPHNTVKKMNSVMSNNARSLPRSFDTRNKWPGRISEPVDQGWCGASWAVSTVGVASDRFGIMSDGFESVQLSAQHLLSCNNRGQQGCEGGHLSRAWMYIRKFGLVDEACYPWKGKAEKCRLPKKITLRTARCQPLNSLRTEPYKTGPAYKLQSEHDIMDEIMESGPVQATMKVYRDFFAYKSGIYTKYSNDLIKDFGYHSVRIVGWGEEPNEDGRSIKFWIAANSWGNRWGENGYFRIVRGTNECEIEDFVIAAWSKTEGNSLRVSPNSIQWDPRNSKNWGSNAVEST